VIEALDNPIALRIRKRNFVEWFKGFWENKLPENIIEGTVLGETLRELKNPDYNLDSAFNGALEVMGHNPGSFKEMRLAGIRGVEGSKAPRPGIETSAPLPEAEASLINEAKKYKSAEELQGRIEALTVEINNGFNRSTGLFKDQQSFNAFKESFTP